MSDTLFPDLDQPPAVPTEKLSADRRRTKRQRAMLAAGVHPITRLKLTQEPGATCGTCALRVQFGHRSKTYAKCTLGAPEDRPDEGPYVTNSAATDCRAWWNGCTSWQAKGDAE